MRRILAIISPYAFVITILWIGFLVAIGALETPLRFQAKIPLVDALSVGHLVFHALNTSEIVFAVILVMLTFLSGAGLATTPQKTLLGIVCLILLVQTILLFTVLDQRTLAIIDGQEVPPASYHAWYVGLDLVKLVLLVSLTVLQIGKFQRDGRDDSAAQAG